MRIPAATWFARWRFLALTIVLCGWLLLAPQLAGAWHLQLMLEAFMLVSALVIVWANPQWRGLRYALLALWAVSPALCWRSPRRNTGRGAGREPSNC